jgi:hypothetical protein
LKGPSNNKACGIDGIIYEHLKYSGKLLEKHLCNLFSMIFDKCVTPNVWKASMIIPLHKGGSQPKTECDAYRGISLISCVCKVFEKLLDCRIDERLNNFMNAQHMAYQKNLNSMFASFDLQEVIHYYIERHSAVIVTFLDSMKAFNTVSHNGLKVKLYELGITCKMWNLLDKMYSNLKRCVRCNNQTSRYFDLSRGIRQGSALSVKLCLICNDELINILSKSGKDAIMVDLNVGCPVQADDIALISSNVPFMQSVIDTCVQYSKRWKFTFSLVKGQVLMKFTKHTMHINLPLDNNIIPECKTLKHVGIILENGFNSTERTIAACSLIRLLSMSIIKQGIHPSVMNPIVCSKIILQLCYTKALYGCELWNNLTTNAFFLPERAHRYVCKYVQGLPKLTRTDKCTTLLGWTSIECYIDSKKTIISW